MSNVKFNNYVNIIFIPSHKEYDIETKKLLWYNRNELKNFERNYILYDICMNFLRLFSICK
jgi:hypothetical protein